MTRPLTVEQNATGPDVFSLSFASPQHYYTTHSRRRDSSPNPPDRYRDGVRLFLIGTCRRLPRTEPHGEMPTRLLAQSPSGAR